MTVLAEIRSHKVKLSGKARKDAFRKNPLILTRSAQADKWLPKYRAALQRLLNSQVNDVARRVEEGLEPAMDDLVDKWFEESLKVKRPYLYAMVEAGIELSTKEFGDDLSPISDPAIKGKVKLNKFEKAFNETPFLQKGYSSDVESWLRATSAKETATSRKRIARSFDIASQFVDPETGRGRTPKQLARILRGRGLAQNKARATMIARTGTIWSYNEGAHQTYVSLGVQVEEWVVTDDDLLCEFCEPMDGRKILINDSFVPAGTTVQGNEGGTLDVPFDVGHAPLHPNCRCVLVPVLEA